MKRKPIVIGLIVVLCAGLGIYALIKSRGTATAPDEEENTPTVVSVQTGALQRMTLHRYVTGYGTVEPAPATPNQPAAGAQLAAPCRRRRGQGERRRRPARGEGRCADGIEFRHGHGGVCGAGSRTAEKIIRTTQHVAENFAGRRGATGPAARHRAACPAPSRGSTSNPARRWT